MTEPPTADPADEEPTRVEGAPAATTRQPDDQRAVGGPDGGVPLDELVMVLLADVSSPSIVRERFRSWLAGLGWPGHAAADVTAAASEAVSNAVEHAYPRPIGEIHVVARQFTEADGGRRIMVGVSDHGRWRTPAADPGHRGHGVPMMYACMDDVQFDRDDGGTTVMMTSARVPPRPEPPS
jgi:serine/threonine-protein kinase RsbW